MKKFKKTLATIMAAVCAASALCVPMSTSATEVTSNNSITSKSVSGYTTYTLDNYYQYEEQQIGSSCWASCILSVIKYQSSTAGVTLEDIYDRTNTLCSTNLSVGDAAPTSAVTVVAGYYLGTQYKNSSLSDIEVVHHIQNGEPIIATFSTSVNGVFHQMVIYGYGRNANGVIDKYYVMNPTIGECTTIAKSNYNWVGTIYYSNLI